MKEWQFPVKYFNANNDPCDTLEGPCICGSTHLENEFKMKDNKLYRDDQLVKFYIDEN